MCLVTKNKTVSLDCLARTNHVPYWLGGTKWVLLKVLQDDYLHRSKADKAKVRWCSLVKSKHP